MSLADFLLARIAEDEALARRAAQEFDGVGVSTRPTWGRRQWEFRVDRRNPALVDFLVAHSPARVLAECEAKRRIVELHQPRRQHPEWVAMGQLPSCAECGSDVSRRVWPCATIGTLALPYADHPDYDEAWRP